MSRDRSDEESASQQTDSSSSGGGSSDDEKWMRRAIALAAKCPASETAFSVGAIIVDKNGEEMSTGFSRDDGDANHAEESALLKLPDADPRLKEATIYTTLEPCSQRKSRPKTCMQLILESGIPRVVCAWREPSLFVVDCQGVETLEAAGVEVVELPDLADDAMRPNRHLKLS